jgi:hypothetical protein
MPTTITRYSFSDDTGDGESGDVINAALIGQAFYDKIDALFAAAAKCQIYNSAVQSLADATYTALTFDSEDHDEFGMHSTSVNTSRITIPAGAGGVYLVGGTIYYVANATGIRGARILKNGATDVVTASFVPAVSSSGLGAGVHIAGLVSLSAADYLELLGFQNSGGALNTGDATRVLANNFFATRVL